MSACLALSASLFSPLFSSLLFSSLLFSSQRLWPVRLAARMKILSFHSWIHTCALSFFSSSSSLPSRPLFSLCDTRTWSPLLPEKITGQRVVSVGPRAVESRAVQSRAVGGKQRKKERERVLGPRGCSSDVCMCADAGLGRLGFSSEQKRGSNSTAAAATLYPCLWCASERPRSGSCGGVAAAAAAAPTGRQPAGVWV